MSAFHECELKLKVCNQEIEKSLRCRLSKTGFTQTDYRIETDSVLDTINNTFGSKNMLFRLREIKRESLKSILFTVKIKGSSLFFQDNMELEVASDSFTLSDANIMAKTIREMTEILIPVEAFALKDRDAIISKLRENEIYIQRTTQKKREEFTGKESKVTFDTFPDPVGTYFEIESSSEEKLYATVRMLNLENSPLEKRSYGQIVKEATNGIKNFVF